jgi:hypothetical protein
VNDSANDILPILDACNRMFTFPMLDNGYVYLAATRLSVFRSPDDWAITIEIFGFSPRSGVPDTHIYTFASAISNRQGASSYAGPYEQYLRNNPHNESRFIYPVLEGDWLDGEYVATGASQIVVRDEPLSLPTIEDFVRCGIQLENEEEISVFEVCRYIADVRRNEVLATPQELTINVGPALKQVLQLDEWNHPNVVDSKCPPSTSETFQQIADLIVTGDVGRYRPTLPPNTHWRNWPDGGTL